MTRKELIADAKKRGVFVTVRSRGDSETLYRFQTVDVDFHAASQSEILGTVRGLSGAVLFWEGFKRGSDSIASFPREAGVDGPGIRRRNKRTPKRKASGKSKKRNPSGRLDLDVSSPSDVSNVLRSAAEVYHESASDLEAAWQSKSSGRPWTKIAVILGASAEKIDRELKKLGW